ncbi:MAG: helix-turn-helix transcriptional regulator, partial [Clostridia bacterium]|nr:helix-turn-helix transcriptional regulator [Clostridia bacterium]
ISRISDKYGIDEIMLTAAYQSLKLSVPDKEYVDTLVAPLLSMIELLSYKQGFNINVRESLFDKILGYLNFNYTKKITVDGICEKFYCSRSYIAHTFKKETGKSLPEYVNGLRIESAKNMLENSNMSIIEIASVTGFEDRSYFSKCFAKETGMSPKQWRLENQRHILQKK